VANLENLKVNIDRLSQIGGYYSTLSLQRFQEVPCGNYVVEISLDDRNKKYSVLTSPSGTDPGFLYLVNYVFYKELIQIWNQENPDLSIPPLYESFSLIGGYRNYHAFNPSISLQDSSASQQIQEIQKTESSKSLNASDQAEPPIFNLVRLRVAEKHYEVFGDSMLAPDSENSANDLDFLKSINKKLELVNLKCKIRLVDRQKWQYAFHFYDTKRGAELTNINSLSAGQKAIIHLVFEAYGRGELKGGLVIIDEPEIHLHYQYQHEYLSVIKEINSEQKSQYVLVTHSESLITSETIDKIRRFTLAEDNSTIIRYPAVSTDQKTLVKILDNTRSTYAFFARKVVLVEGDTDRYFFRAVFQKMHPELSQEIAILNIGGKDSYLKWKEFFEGFGLKLYYIGDLDNVFSHQFADGNTLLSRDERNTIASDLKQYKLDHLNDDQKSKLKKVYSELVAHTEFLTAPKSHFWDPLISKINELAAVPKNEITANMLARYPDLKTNIESKYSENVFILQAGALEAYTGKPHSDVNATIAFCEGTLPSWIIGDNEPAQEIRNIVSAIAGNVNGLN
jgi:predicted ATPase